jgi:hypothetical protein
MKYLKTFSQMFESSINEPFNLQTEFDYINKIAFNNELRPIKLQFVKTRASGGKLVSQVTRDRFRRIIDEKIISLDISTYYSRSLEQYRNILAHEMIHLWIAQNKLRDDSHHGYIFQKKMRELNKLGFDINLKDDAFDQEQTDMTPLNKPVILVLINNVTDDKSSIAVMDYSLFTDENVESIRDTIEYTAGKRQYLLSFIESTDRFFEKYPKTRKFKYTSSLKFFYYNKAQELLDNSVKNGKVLKQFGFNEPLNN